MGIRRTLMFRHGITDMRDLVEATSASPPPSEWTADARTTEVGSRNTLLCLREYPRELADRLIAIGLEVGTVEELGSAITGPLLVGRVTQIEELTEFKETDRFCQVDLGDQTRGIICGATNFAEGDLIVAALPGSVLPGGFEISAPQDLRSRQRRRQICSGANSGSTNRYDGILVWLTVRVGQDARPILGLDDAVSTSPSPRTVAVACRSAGSPGSRPGLQVVTTGSRFCWSLPPTGPQHLSRQLHGARALSGIDPGAASPTT